MESLMAKFGNFDSVFSSGGKDDEEEEHENKYH